MKIDTESLLCHGHPDFSLRKLQNILLKKGFQFPYAPAKRTDSLRRVLEERIPNRWALRYGEIDDLCVRVTGYRKGHTWTTRNLPRSATGPDLKKILIGSGRRYGKILEVSLQIVPVPETTESISFKLPVILSREDFLKKFWASGIRPRRLDSEGKGRFTIELEGKNEIVSAEKSSLERIVSS